MSLISSLLSNQTFTMIRKGDGVYNENGRYVEQETTSEVQGMIQPYRRTQTGSQIILPEGITADDTVVVWTSTLLRSSNEYSSTQADVVIYNNLRYEIQDVSTWSGYSGLINEHYECLAVLETKRG